ncbi:MAG: hypothetical protein DI542_04195 [Acinetobacter johnsonii]|uniref:Uncharacterized protein n=1 Tax=Acinetobacter johnsonii TaxID=40214 RepID=A0A2W5S1K4_ACIJO|nr:hypothetical protein [Acinetobacter johnsonii]PZQ92855.1 MAG: hypothetical protein DI542_04195 [Acinetobacter johnsonii]RZN87388.1 hypothetical protein EXE24_14865 [Acinetobacter johnsonii]UIZ99405.1 hypothetical protein GBN68_09465 [Acinetobacter johnsonii]
MQRFCLPLSDWNTSKVNIHIG